MEQVDGNLTLNKRKIQCNNFEHCLLLGIETVFRDPNTSQYYKKDQEFEKTIYFNCFLHECNGRIRVNRDSNSKKIVSHHSDHTTNVVLNEVRIFQLKKMILKMAGEAAYKNYKPKDIYSTALKKIRGLTLPINHERYAIKSVINARHRIQQKKGEYFFNF